MFGRLRHPSVVSVNTISLMLARPDITSVCPFTTLFRSMKHRLCLDDFIGLVGFEPTASWTRTRRSTKLSHSPKINELPDRRPLTSRILIQIARAGAKGNAGSQRSSPRGLGSHDQNPLKTADNTARSFNACI